MQITIKDLPQSQKELTIEISKEDMAPHIKWAAEELSKATSIEGFRPGKAPFDVIQKKYGDMKILEVAADKVVKQTFFQALKEKELDSVGPPQIKIEKMAPDNDFVYKATVSILPTIKLADWKKMKLERKPKAATEKEVEKVLTDLRKMQAKEVIVERPATKADKLVVDMDILLDKVPVEGGQSKNYAIYLDEDFYLPGLADKLINAKQGDLLEFQHDFPETFFNKMLAGKKGDFKVNVKAVYERTLADVNDDMAKALGQKNVEDLKKTIKENLEAESTQKEEQRVEIEMLQNIIKETTFGEVPELLITEEKHKMFAELKQNLDQQGISFEDYLKNLKKTEEEIAAGFSKGAEERAKTALALRQIAKEEKLLVSPEELKEEMQRVREMYKDNDKIDERLEDPEIQNFIATSLLNRQVLHLLKDTILGPAPVSLHAHQHDHHDHEGHDHSHHDHAHQS
ncbi:MAG: trigger factor [Candidatus Magasanikbacteria bacterium]|nr:trigger factor [Candidatus Magasanikbacteria bacterium]